ncbi:hypothetical protein MASR1M45_00120 [Candidatus Kapaibacterium sp.]
MTNYKLNIFFIFIIGVLFFSTVVAKSQNFISDSLYPSKKDRLLFEVADIKFSGNEAFSAYELIDAVNSKMNSRSIQHDVFEYYLDNLKKIDFTPEVLKKSLQVALKNLSHEIKYFNEGTAELDVQTLWHFYNTNGYHFVDVNYEFIPNYEKKQNELIFKVKENDRYKIDAIIYNGLENLDTETSKMVADAQKIRRGDYYSERNIMSEANHILNILLNNGYYYSSLEIAPVIINTDNLTDKVIINFTHGKRQRIIDITYVDSLNNQFKVIDDMKNLQLDIKVGDWYSRANVQSSINNLLILGTFELVTIDTSGVFYPLTDSTLSMVVFTKYRKQKEWGVGLFVHNTQLDNFTNIGVEANLLHRNWGGAAQSGNIFTNARIKNVSRLFAGQAGEYEGQVGLRIAQPLIWSIENMKIGANASIYYSLSTVDQIFNISSWFIPVRFPIKLTNDTYLNQIIVDFNFEFQNPTNFVDYDESKENTGNFNPRFYQSLALYSNLYEYLNSPETTLLTSNLFGITLIGDSRNHPFNPNFGDYFYFMLDGWNIFFSHPWISGIAKYLRVQSTYNFFLPISNTSVSAFKIRAGLINLADDYNSFVPFERQFFAGGANSVRGWLSRELHYSTLESVEYAGNTEPNPNILDSRTYNLISNIVGSSAIIEGSYEFRFTFERPKGIDEVLAEQISKIGLTFFLDFGNAYHWYAETDQESKLKWYEYFSKLAWAAGFGVRYDTPIGPVRLDFGFPVYRPGYNVPDYVLWNNGSLFGDMKLHFGIGHSF